MSTTSIAYNGTATFTITVVNQGNVPSGQFTVTDVVPVGLDVIAATNNATMDSSRTITWSMTSLDVGQSVQLTITVRSVDLSKRPYLNRAEIATDSSATYSTSADPVVDEDSTPGDLDTNGIDNTLIAEAGNGDDGGFDDEDVAQLDVGVVYDLALIKTVGAGQKYLRGATINFEIQVRNQGNVPSGVFTVHDIIPAGMSFVAASDGGLSTANVVTWNLSSLAPGVTKSLTIQLRLDDISQLEYRNVAEITSDSSIDYSTPSVVVRDVDSTPDDAPSNDLLVDRTTFDGPISGPDEDDHDIAILDPAQVLIDNKPPPGKLPVTGGDILRILMTAGGALLIGSVLMWGRRRRRVQVD